MELRLATAYSGHLQQWLDAGELDVSLLYNLTNLQLVHVRPLVQDNLWALAPSEAGLRPDEPVELATVLRQPFIMPISGRHGLRVLLDQARLGLDVEPNVTAQANDMALQKLLVKAGRGWTVLPAVGVAADVANGIFSAAPICNPEITRTLAIGLQRRDRPAPAVNAVATELVRVIGTAVADGTWPSAELLLNEPRASARVADGRMGRA